MLLEQKIKFKKWFAIEVELKMFSFLEQGFFSFSVLSIADDMLCHFYIILEMFFASLEDGKQ